MGNDFKRQIGLIVKKIVAEKVVRPWRNGQTADCGPVRHNSFEITLSQSFRKSADPTVLLRVI